MTRFSFESGDDNFTENKLCRICYDVDKFVGNNFLSPCRCRGSVKWVHAMCFQRWMECATREHHIMCNVCGYTYRWSWNLKPLERWTWPRIRLSIWEAVEIMLDVLGTVKMVRNTIDTIRGTRSFFVQAFSFLLWRMFIATHPRIAYYKAMYKRLMFSVFESRVQNFRE